MSKKIIQIIPAPSGMYAEYRTDEGEIEHIPVVSLMLVDDDGLQYLSPATFDAEYGAVSYTHLDVYKRQHHHKLDLIVRIVQIKGCNLRCLIQMLHVSVCFEHLINIPFPIF